MSIELEKVICNNFLTFGENVVIPLNTKGITLILGELDGDSNQSNGAGKSSILSAITYAWYGRCTRGRAADSVVNRFANENCFVELHWKDGTDTYIVRRSRKLKGTKPNDLTLHKNGTDITRTTAVATQAVLDAEVGISYAAFLALMPGTNKLAEMSDAEIKELIESILGLHKYAQAHEKCKELLGKETA
jgi:DNA repair exonuclease SbcCD ATPase subunit